MTILSAQSKTDEDYDKLMKAVGAANGAMRKAANEQTPPATEAAKMVALFKDAQQFWTARNNEEAAEWAGAAMKHADAQSRRRRTTPRRSRRMKELGGTCQTCHTKYREKTETGFVIKKG